VTLAGLTINTVVNQISHEQRGLEQRFAAIANGLAISATNAIVVRDYHSLEEILLQFAAYPGVRVLQVTNPSGKGISRVVRSSSASLPEVSYEYGAAQAPSSSDLIFYWMYGDNRQGQSMLFGLDATRLVLWQPIDNAALGWLNIELDTVELQREAQQVVLRNLYVALSSIAFGMILFLWFMRAGVRALQQATQFSQRLNVDHGKKLDVYPGTLELQSLGEALNYASSHLHVQEMQLVNARIAAEAANRAKSEFLSNMSHEIRTPLTAIIGFTRTLTDSTLSVEERERAILSIDGAGGRLLGVINNIIDYSELESGQISLGAKPFSPYVIIEEVARAAQERAKLKNIALSVYYEMPLPTQIVGDPLRFRQILANLCLNATTFTERGGIALRVRGDTAEGHLTVDVEDTGIGMAAGDIERIFLPFTQADTSSSRQYGGVGLGLAIAQKLTQRLNGQIKCTSAKGVGSTFSLCVPVGSAETLRWVDKEEELDKGIKRGGDGAKRVLKGNILLVEDTILNQKLIKLALSKLGLECVIVENGQLAVEYALSHQLDLILMDIQMPIMDGVTATVKLRQAGFMKPIIAVTANVMADDRAKYLAAGIVEVVEKPIDPVTMYGVLSKYLPPDLSEASNSAQ